MKKILGTSVKIARIKEPWKVSHRLSQTSTMHSAISSKKQISSNDNIPLGVNPSKDGCGRRGRDKGGETVRSFQNEVKPLYDESTKDAL